TLHLLRAAKASAALSGREYALPDDIQALAVAVLAHRLLPTAQAQLNRRTAEQVVLEILQRTPVPAAPQSPSGLGMGRGSSAFGQQPPRRL
ncbi:AAA family ATPase, partial [Streptomyces umbrinus]